MHARSTIPMLFAPILLSMPAAAQYDSGCTSSVTEALDQLGIGEDQVDGVVYSTIRSPSDHGRLQKVLAWVDLVECPGRQDLVLSLDRRCQVRAVDVRGACTVPGVD